MKGTLVPHAGLVIGEQFSSARGVPCALGMPWSVPSLRPRFCYDESLYDRTFEEESVLQNIGRGGRARQLSLASRTLAHPIEGMFGGLLNAGFHSAVR